MLHIKSRFPIFLLLVFLMPVVLTGCLSHWFVDSTSRLQVENSTEEYSIVGVDVLAEDGSSMAWIEETVLPGERSRVVEADWVGSFSLRFKFTRSTDGSGTVFTDDRKFDLDGGSLYLTVKAEGDSLTYKFR